MAGAIVLDTCVVLWRAFEVSELSGRAARLIEESDRIIISSITFWEIGIKIGKKTIDLGISLSDFAARIESAARIEVVPVTTSIWIRNIQLEWNHRDPADRTIIATAIESNCALITPDKDISDFYNKTIW